ncbi:MAG TPA: penicillin-binding protein 1C, partial [Pasteurellaceae bacterium]|nr:penicillin-binding protein 1C [Pasteurellaceae bacterium]
FNFAPYGRNIEGAGTAGRIYFNKPNLQINLAEAMTLAILPKNPNTYIRQKNEDLNRSLFNARNSLYRRWLKIHPEDQKWQTDFQLSYPIRPLEKLPFFAPHFTDQMLQQYPDQYEIKTSLNSNLQRLVERVTQRYLSQQAERGVQNVSVLLVDNRTMEVKALIGSGNYFNSTISGQINGTAVKRSYGSTLKPFIYALAFDQGLAHQRTVLKDLPTSFNDYQPENYEGNFLGPVNLTHALLLSRNIPAIEIAAKLKSPDLYDFLQQSNMQLPKAKEHYGLALVLGGTELSSQQLATLYAMLANQGKWQPLQWLKNAKQTSGKQLLSPESAVMISDILRRNQRPAIHNKAVHPRLQLYWKTGTSNGLRDAWTAGYFGHYTLVVWFGNFNNKNNPHFIGRSLATPLFVQLADAIIGTAPQMRDIQTAPNLNLKSLSVCATDGDLPNQFCPRQVNTLFIPVKSPINVSRIHQAFTVQKGSDILACPPYDPANTEQKVYEIWSSDFQAIFAQAGIMKRAPITNPQCPHILQNESFQIYVNKPQITSPVSGRRYHLQANHTDQRIPLTATVAGDVKILYWFVNNGYLGKTSPHEPLFWQPRIGGNYRISVTDDQGRSVNVNVFVEMKK